MSILPRRFSTEIVYYIFDCLFPAEAKRALRYGLVCKEWFNVWLSYRWHTIDELSRVLIVVLGGLHVSFSTFVCYHKVTHGSWPLFVDQKLANRYNVVKVRNRLR